MTREEIIDKIHKVEALYAGSPSVTDAIAIHGHDIIDLVATHPDGIRLSQLMEIVSERYGRMATFHTCSAGALYGRSKPLVNVCLKPGEWQSFDIIFHRPLFDDQGKVVRRATFTVFHNGVLIQDHVILSGGTG